MIQSKIKLITLLFSFTALFILSGCSHSNKITDSWTNPDATKESIKFEKVAVFGLVMKSETRRLIEDELSRRLVNTIAVPAYKVISEDDLGKTDLIKGKLIEKGFDGALILRLIDVEVRESYSPGMYPGSYYSFDGYYNYSWGYMYSTGGMYQSDQIVTAEVNIYSLREDKLIWSGETVSMNPSDINLIISELSESVKAQLIDDGLLDEQPK
jgi:hypothetical protein